MGESNKDPLAQRRDVDLTLVLFDCRQNTLGNLLG